MDGQTDGWMDGWMGILVLPPEGRRATAQVMLYTMQPNPWRLGINQSKGPLEGHWLDGPSAPPL